MEVLSSEPFDIVIPDSGKRSPGCHVSDIIKYMLIHLDPDTYDTEVDEATRRRWAMGFLWEDVVADALCRKHEATKKSMLVQVEQELDGVYGTPDAFDLQRWILHEYKYTWISSNRDITDFKFRHWIWQTQAYLKMLEADRVDFIVCHARGDYSAHDIMVVRYRLQFTQREIDRNWAMLLRNRDEMLGEAA